MHRWGAAGDQERDGSPDFYGQRSDNRECDCRNSGEDEQKAKNNKPSLMTLNLVENVPCVRCGYGSLPNGGPIAAAVNLGRICDGRYVFRFDNRQVS